MKSRLFYALASQPDVAPRLLDDLVVLLSLNAEQSQSIVHAVLESTDKAITINQRQAIAESVGNKLGLGAVAAASAMESLKFILDQQLDETFGKDSAETLGKDLEEYGRAANRSITQAQVDKFIELTKFLRVNVLPDYRKIRDRKTTATGVLPSLKTFGTTVELRAIVENLFRVGMDSAKYSPKISGVVPIVSIRIKTDSGSIDEFAFQTDEKVLAAFIEELKSAQVILCELNRVTKFSNKKGIS